MRLRPSTGAFSLPRTVSGGAGNAKGVIMQPEQTHPRPRGFRRRLLGDIFHGVKRYLILGVAATLERLGIDASEAIAFGDGENDLSMFSAVGTSVAMGNAQDTVKAAATYVTTAVDDDGIYNAAKHFGLI